jgi:hypothetical protein
MTVYVHIGLHKTGTSSIQTFLKRNKPALQARGYLYPRTGWTAGGHHNLAYELLGRKRFSTDAGRLADLEAEIAPAANVILSSEEFEFLELAQVRAFQAALGERPVRVLVYLRRQDALIASTYAQQVKMGARMKTFDGYARDSLYNARFDFALLLDRWASVFGKEALDIAVVSEETAGARLYDDFLGRVGLGAAVDLARPPKRLNESPSAAEVEIVRRAAEQARRPGRPPRPQDMVQLQQIVAGLAAATPDLQSSGRLVLPPDLYDRVAARFMPGNSRIASMVGSRLQRDALVFGDSLPAAAPEPADAALARAAAKALRQWDFAAGAGD